MKRKGGNILTSKSVQDSLPDKMPDSITLPDSITCATSHSTIQSEGSATEFQMMDVSITILGLMTGGIIMKTTKNEHQRIISRKTPIHGNVPLFAVISSTNRLDSSYKNVATSYLPSKMMVKPFQSSGHAHKFPAVWQNDLGQGQNDTSSIKLSRRLKKSTIIAGIDKNDNDIRHYLYTAEKLDLSLNLMRGSELITLGTISVFFTGQEEKRVQSNLPIKIFQKDTKKGNGLNVKGTKYQMFNGDKTRKYRLDEDSILSVLIQSSPTPQPKTTPAEFVAKIANIGRVHFKADECLEEKPLFSDINSTEKDTVTSRQESFDSSRNGSTTINSPTNTIDMFTNVFSRWFSCSSSEGRLSNGLNPKFDFVSDPVLPQNSNSWEEEKNCNPFTCAGMNDNCLDDDDYSDSSEETNFDDADYDSRFLLETDSSNDATSAIDESSTFSGTNTTGSFSQQEKV